MHKKVVIFLVTLIFFMILVGGAMSIFLKLRKEKTYYYKADDSVIANPYIGFAPDCTNEELCEKNSLVYMNLIWSELEPSEGEFDWDGICEEYQLRRWKDSGKHLVLRFVCDYPGAEEHMDIPKWLYDKTGDGEFYDIEYGRGYCPDYNNEVFIEEHKKALLEIGRYFGEDDFLAYVELGSLGHWGEWHTYYPAGIPKMPLIDVRSIYVEHYVEAFPYAKLLMRRPFYEMPDNFGVFNDMTGAEEDTVVWLDWIKNGGSFNETKEDGGLRKAENVWEKAPVGGEFTSSIPMSTMLGEDLGKTISLIRDSHMSFIGPKVPEDLRCNGIIDSNLSEVLKNIGYRYRVHSMTMKNINKSETSLTITMVNDGVAPIYFDYLPYIYIENEDGELFEKLELPIDLKTLYQNCKSSAEVIVPRDMLKEDGARIYISIEKKKVNEPEIYLAMQADRQGARSLLWEQ